MRPAVRSLPYLGLVSLLLAPACGSEGSVADVLLVASVEVSPPGGTLLPQETLQLEAIPKTAGGLVLPARNVAWSSSAPALVEVSSTGMVRALSIGGPVQIHATIEGVQGTATITVTPIPVDHVTISPSQTSLVIGEGRQLTATAHDAGGAILPGRSFLWESSAPSIAPVTTGGLVLGQAEGGPVTVTATSGGKAGTASVTVTRRPATRLGFAQQPGLAIAGQVMVPAIRVAIQDDLLNTVTNATNSVTIALAANPGGATLSGTKTVAAVNGIATFNTLSLDRAGTGYTLSATATGLSSITSTPFNVNAGAANRLDFSVQPPAAARSGVALSPQPVLQLNDGAGNPVAQAGVTVTASIASGAGSLGGATTAVTNSSGTAAFADLALIGSVGSYTIAFSGSGILSVTSAPIALSAGPPASLSITRQPSSSAQSGTAFAQQPQLQLRDQADNPVAQSGVVITASIATGPAGATLGGTIASTNSSGVATFGTLSLSGPAGSYTLAFAATGLTAAFSNTITVGAGTGTNLSITTQPSSSVASGAVFPRQPVVQLRDAAGNPVLQAGVSVTASIQTGVGTLGGTTTVSSNASGAASFTDLSITGTAGDRTLSFSAPGFSGVTSSSITVTTPQLSLTTQPSSTVQSGVVFPQQPVVQLKDGSNNPVSGVVVTVAIGSGGGTLGGTLTATTDAAGLAGFTDLSISGTVGTRTLSFSAPAFPTATSGSIDVTAGPASQLSITTQPSSTVQSGAVFPQQPVIQVSDAFGNPVSGAVVSAAIASGGGTLGGNMSATTGASGAASFTGLSISGSPGDRTLSFTTGSLPGVISQPITVTSGTPSKLSITTQPPSSAQSGVAFSPQPVVQVQDAGGLPVSGVVVTAAIASGGGTLGGIVTATSDANGLASFTDLSISGTIGNRTLSFSASGVSAVVSNPIDLTAGPASQLSITQEPSGLATHGVAFPRQPIIQVLDAAGNPVSQSGITVTATINTATNSGGLGGTTAVNTNGSGIATYNNLKISKAGDYTLKFSSPGLTDAISITILVL